MVALLFNVVDTARQLPEPGDKWALENLVARGWITQENGKHVATGQGKAFRQEAEDVTDCYFDAAWASLSEAEMEELQGLLCRLAEALEPAENEPGQ
jgi:hypothetical protein